MSTNAKDTCLPQFLPDHVVSRGVKKKQALNPHDMAVRKNKKTEILWKKG